MTFCKKFSIFFLLMFSVFLFSSSANAAFRISLSQSGLVWGDIPGGPPWDGSVEIKLYTSMASPVPVATQVFPWGSWLGYWDGVTVFPLANDQEVTVKVEFTNTAALTSATDLWIEIYMDGVLKGTRQVVKHETWTLFANEAVNADTVDGKHATDFASSADLASHASNASAHHVKTKSFAEMTVGQVVNSQIANGAVTTFKIATGGVTNTDLGTNSVTTTKIATNGVTNTDIANNAVTDAKILGPISAAKIGFGINADKVDGLQASSLLRSNASDAYTSGTLSFNSGTTLALNGNVKLKDSLNFNVLGSPADLMFSGTDLTITLGDSAPDKVKIPGRIQYSTPRTLYYNVSGNAFDKSDFYTAKQTKLNSGYIYTSTGGGSYFYAYAPVHLPEGAAVTALTAYSMDKSTATGHNMSVTLYRKGVTALSSTLMASVTRNTSVAYSNPAVISTTDTTISNPVIANGSANYFLSLYWYNTTASANLQFHGARITYTITDIK